MEDFILREIDRIGEMMLVVARKLGLLDGGTPNYTLANVKEEFAQADLPGHHLPFRHGRGPETSPIGRRPCLSGRKGIFLL